jgi:hypothetical protein
MAGLVSTVGVVLFLVPTLYTALAGPGTTNTAWDDGGDRKAAGRETGLTGQSAQQHTTGPENPGHHVGTQAGAGKSQDEEEER